MLCEIKGLRSKVFGLSIHFIIDIYDINILKLQIYAVHRYIVYTSQEEHSSSKKREENQHLDTIRPLSPSLSILFTVPSISKYGTAEQI